MMDQKIEKALKQLDTEINHFRKLVEQAQDKTPNIAIFYRLLIASLQRVKRKLK